MGSSRRAAHSRSISVLMNSARSSEIRSASSLWPLLLESCLSSANLTRNRSSYLVGEAARHLRLLSGWRRPREAASLGQSSPYPNVYDQSWSNFGPGRSISGGSRNATRYRNSTRTWLSRTSQSSVRLAGAARYSIKAFWKSAQVGDGTNCLSTSRSGLSPAHEPSRPFRSHCAGM